MYQKFLVVASKKDVAGMNITTQLSQFRKNPLLSAMNSDGNGFDFYLVDNEIIFTENLDMEKINKYDFVVFASKHRSSSPNRQKALTIHSVGNLRKADFGGETGKISPTSAIFQKQLFENLKMNADNFNLKDYEITLEATHHGPLISKPSVFIEIGPTEEEWKNRKAGFIVAKTINDTILGFEENPYNEIAIALGGPHYCPNFNKIQLKSNVAISHVIAQYNFPFTEEMLLESLNKTDEKIDFAILDWKGLGTTEQRSEIVRILEKNYVQWKKTGDVDK